MCHDRNWYKQLWQEQGQGITVGTGQELLQQQSGVILLQMLLLLLSVANLVGAQADMSVPE